MRHTALFALLAVASLACGSSGGGSLTLSRDGGPTEDATTADQGMDAGADGDDAGPPPMPVGKTIAKGQVSLLGVTDDGYVVYATGTSVAAAPVAGGTSTTIATYDSADAGGDGVPAALVQHDNVFVWTNVDEGSGSGTLTVWSHALTTPKSMSTASTPFLVATSDDSTSILFSTETASDGSTTSVVGTTLGSSSAPVTLVAGIDPGGGASSCAPSVAFSGTGATTYAIVSSCPVTSGSGTPDAGLDAGVDGSVDGGGDAGSLDAADGDDDGGGETSDGPNSVLAFSTADWKAVTLASGALAFSVDDTGTAAAIALTTGQLQIVPLAGGSPIVIDDGTDAGALGNEPAVYLSRTDAFVLYATSLGALTSSKTSASLPVTLAPTGAANIDAVSPSGTWALIDNGVDPMLGVATGLTLVGTAAGATTTTFASSTTGLYGDAFTADSKYVLYLADASADDEANTVGTLTASPVTSPSTVISVSTSAGSSSPTTFVPSVLQSGNLSNALTVAGSVTDLALTGSAIAFSNNFDGSSGLLGETDIQVKDLSTTNAAQTVVKRADPAFVVSFDKKYILYTITFGANTDGLYSVIVP